eukprot:CAMPEP_0196764834 /NCGR_PEP_ID=MMETSP1095-20130614/6959_1 /TAXON_ID=96789 ORGANISM="Chromulina nebulosa, Strain UTEXLB2642" /NCGR_SAMPLE_ID=MMETSP1095 /ASSEMBLY_ACC=CAM_ASM_000446 /LENGTH=286 /DNA_ID=CAMNT_0042121413 /DNA_START=259 /DNA_END=1119 /DNA_ORIENTATION=-
MRFREQEIMNIPGSDERWENWMQFVQAQLVPTFTTQGFDVIHVPKNVYEKLRDAVLTAVEDWDNIPLEGEVEAIYGDLPPKFVDIGELAWDTIEELKSLHEDWAGGMKLRPTSAYGVRLYQNGSSLAMHNDKIHSHVISSIIHIAHEYDNDDEPWPIQIEDHNGVLHSVALQPGEMLFYESARCLHGRMTELKGKYYGSIFVHYQPVDPRIWSYTVEDVIASVPPHWSENMPDDHGSRWAGQSITTDSRVAAGAPPRIRDSDTQPFQRTNINQKRRAVSVQSPSNA